VSTEPGGSDRHINIQVSPEMMAGVYANFANVSHSDYEFTITFARVDHEVEASEVPASSSPREPVAALHEGADDCARGQLLALAGPRGDQESAGVEGSSGDLDE